MAAVTATQKSTLVSYPVTRNTLTASDTIAYTQGAHQHLELYNTTASPIVVNIAGSTSSTISPTGYGGTISVSGGKSITVPASSTQAVDLDAISAWLQGTVTITNGVGLIAHLYVS